MTQSNQTMLFRLPEFFSCDDYENSFFDSDRPQSYPKPESIVQMLKQVKTIIIDGISLPFPVDNTMPKASALFKGKSQLQLPKPCTPHFKSSPVEFGTGSSSQVICPTPVYADQNLSRFVERPFLPTSDLVVKLRQSNPSIKDLPGDTPNTQFL